MQMKQRNTSDSDSTVESSVERCAAADDEDGALTLPDMPGKDTGNMDCKVVWSAKSKSVNWHLSNPGLVSE